MEKKHETGHAINVIKFEELYMWCSKFGKKFNPAKAAIKLENMQAMIDQGKARLEEVKVAHSKMSTAITMRSRAFGELDKLVTRINNAVASLDILPEAITKIAASVRKFRGVRAKPLPEEEGTKVMDENESVDKEVEKRNAKAQRSYNRKVVNFKNLVALVEAEANYLPNELELQIESLRAVVNEIETRNLLAKSTRATFITAIIARDKLLYEENIGMVPSAYIAKKYVKSVFGPTSREFKTISPIPFTYGSN
ncbi:MAG: hypothetical protein ACK5RG_21780 [Cyclobacteriaceae bacterium]|jgi:hypothetical protein|nr:hypothetical protein [Flammeovirgaceae bacterium]